MNAAFLGGFVKQAQNAGITENEALRLAKVAGFMGSLGDLAGTAGRFGWNMVGKPAWGMLKDPVRAQWAMVNGHPIDAIKAQGSAIGNTALTALNFVPVLGEGGMAARLGFKGLGMGAKALEAAGADGRLAEGVSGARNTFNGVTGALRNEASNVGQGLMNRFGVSAPTGRLGRFGNWLGKGLVSGVPANRAIDSTFAEAPSAAATEAPQFETSSDYFY